MLYNKSLNRKINDRKIMHKVKKHWVVISTALLMGLGGSLLSAKAPAHANVNTNSNDSQIKNQNPVKETMKSQLTGQNSNQSMGANKSQASQNNSSMSKVSASSKVDQIKDQASQMHKNILNNAFTTSSINKKHRLLGDVPTGTGYITVNYVDPNTERFVASDSYKGTPGQQLSDGFFNNVKNSIPKGYTFDKFGNKVTQYPTDGASDNLSVDITLSNSELQKPKVTFEYVIPTLGGAQVPNALSRKSDMGVNGTNLNYVPYILNTPAYYYADKNPNDYHQSDYSGSGYNIFDYPIIMHANSSDMQNVKNNLKNNIITYKPGDQTVQIGVEPMVQMHVQFIDPSSKSSIPVKTISVNGVVGTPFNIHNYINKIPNYKVSANQSQKFPSEFNFTNAYDDGSHDLSLLKSKTSRYPQNKPQPITVDVVPTSAQMKINYVLDGQSAPIKSLTVSGNTGEPFNIKAYKHTHYLPSNYSVAHVNNVQTTFENGRTMTIYIRPKQVTMPINYQLSNGKNVKTINVSGLFGTPFDARQYTNDTIIKDNDGNVYRVLGNNLTNNPTYQTNPVIFTVVPEDSMMVKFVDQSRPTRYQDIDTISLLGDDGAAFQVAPYLAQVPKGYSIVGFKADNPTKFQDPNNQFTVYVTNVAANRTSAAAKSASASASASASKSASNAAKSASASKSAASAKAASEAQSVANSKAAASASVAKSVSASQASSVAAASSKAASMMKSIAASQAASKSAANSMTAFVNTQSTTNSEDANYKSMEASIRATIQSLTAKPNVAQGSTAAVSNSQSSNSNSSALTSNEDITKRHSKAANQHEYNHKSDNYSDSVNTVGLNDVDAHNGSFGKRGAKGVSQLDNTGYRAGHGYVGSSQLGSGQLGSGLNRLGADADHVANASNTADVQQKSANKLPQTGESNSQSQAMAALLLTLGGSIGALGYGLRRRRHGDKD